MKVEFFGADVGDKSTNVSSAGFSSNGTLGEKTPLNAASNNAATKVDENRHKQRPQNRPRLVFVVAKAFGVARLGEQDVSRGHDRGVLMVKDSGS